MNHTNIKLSLASHIQRAKNLAYLGHPYVLGELNSMARQGIDGETNVFGDALWLVDFSLWAGANVSTLFLMPLKIVIRANNDRQNIKRLHFHQGLNYRYASWQPILGKGQPPTTCPPYYGQIMVAAALGQQQDARIVNIPLSEDTESAYAIYNGDRLSKLAVVNLRAFNQTSSTRPSKQYQFQVPNSYRQGKVERLIAPGSDSLKGITFSGTSYDYDRKEGRPVVVDSKKEVVSVENGVLSVDVPDASAVLVSLS